MHFPSQNNEVILKVSSRRKRRFVIEPRLQRGGGVGGGGGGAQARACGLACASSASLSSLSTRETPKKEWTLVTLTHPS